MSQLSPAATLMWAILSVLVSELSKEVHAKVLMGPPTPLMPNSFYFFYSIIYIGSTDSR